MKAKTPAKTVKKKSGPPPVAKNKLDAIGVAAISNMISEGIPYREIARQSGVGLGTLYDWIEDDVERSQACARAREKSAQTWDDKAVEGVEDADDMFELAKAKELAIHYRWRAKAVNPKRYGDKQTVDLTAKVSLNVISEFPE